jgi:hypothetical protein
MSPTDTASTGAIGLALFVTICAIVMVLIPFIFGLRASLRAFAVTRRVNDRDIERALKSERGDPGEPVSVQVLRVLRSSLRESQGTERMPTAFLVDASRQYVTNEVRANYIDPISMFSNILPPIGFIGTLIGLVVLVLSKESGSETLELVGLAGAVSKSILALFGFIVLESLKILLYGRMMGGLDDALGLYQRQSATSRHADARAS